MEESQAKEELDAPLGKRRPKWTAKAMDASYQMKIAAAYYTEPMAIKLHTHITSLGSMAPLLRQIYWAIVCAEGRQEVLSTEIQRLKEDLSGLPITVNEIKCWIMEQELPYDEHMDELRKLLDKQLSEVNWGFRLVSLNPEASLILNVMLSKFEGQWVKCVSDVHDIIGRIVEHLQGKREMILEVPKRAITESMYSKWGITESMDLQYYMIKRGPVQIGYGPKRECVELHEIPHFEGSFAHVEGQTRYVYAQLPNKQSVRFEDSNFSQECVLGDVSWYKEGFEDQNFSQEYIPRDVSWYIEWLLDLCFSPECVLGDVSWYMEGFEDRIFSQEYIAREVSWYMEGFEDRIFSQEYIAREVSWNIEWLVDLSFSPECILGDVSWYREGFEDRIFSQEYIAREVSWKLLDLSFSPECVLGDVSWCREGFEDRIFSQEYIARDVSCYIEWSEDWYIKGPGDCSGTLRPHEVKDSVFYVSRTSGGIPSAAAAAAGRIRRRFRIFKRRLRVVMTGTGDSPYYITPSGRLVASKRAVGLWTGTPRYITRSFRRFRCPRAPPLWIYDTGSSVSVTGDLSLLRGVHDAVYMSSAGVSGVELVSNKCGHIRSGRVKLYGVRYFPGAKVNLISGGILASLGCEIIMNVRGLKIMKDGQVIGGGRRLANNTYNVQYLDDKLLGGTVCPDCRHYY